MPGIPSATYRLQFNKKFRFSDAEALVPYLRQLGISDVYASPVFKARKGSMHGYDVTDPARLNPEIGTEAEFHSLCDCLSKNTMGLLLDIVPNHLAIDPENGWWQDVVKNERHSRYAHFFDTNWLDLSGNTPLIAGYRRFFNIDHLIGVRVEDAEVFSAMHSLVLKLVAERSVTGLRIDHVDGLYDPAGYLERLQQQCTAVIGSEMYTVVEKILAADEILNETWPVHGTTGYDFISQVNAIFVDSRNIKKLSALYADFTGKLKAYPEVVYEKKKMVLKTLFSREINGLGALLIQLLRDSGVDSGVTRGDVVAGLIEITACLSVYRTYIRSLTVEKRDFGYITRAVQSAQSHNKIQEANLSLLERVLLLDFPPELSYEKKKQWLSFVMKWQQLTGAVMAKGVEDTALYNYHRLESLNEVGSEPDAEGASIAGFHRWNLHRMQQTPFTMNTSSTHDTKKSEDVRARINVLSEIPDEWRQTVEQWHLLNRDKRGKVKGVYVPDANTELHLYQVLLGNYPFSRLEVPQFYQRLRDYVIKAVREAKTHTDWINPDERYEKALLEFVDTILEDKEDNAFLASFRQFQPRIAFYGVLNSLSQLLLKVTSPGVPDFYQGAELWNFCMVDPDNRRPVDFTMRKQYLTDMTERLRQELIAELLAYWQDGRLKLFVTWQALSVRNQYHEVFRSGEYLPLKATGNRQTHLCCFARRFEEKWIVTCAPRFFTRLAVFPNISPGEEVWKTMLVQLPEDAPLRWRSIFTGEELAVRKGSGIPAAAVLSLFPVALLVSE